jgi:hypothetical protein
MTENPLALEDREVLTRILHIYGVDVKLERYPILRMKEYLASTSGLAIHAICACDPIRTEDHWTVTSNPVRDTNDGSLDSDQAYWSD